MDILVTGAEGMLGTALMPALKQRHNALGINRQDCDIRDASAITSIVRARRPQLVIHLAAFTNVDAAEADPQTTEEINADGARNVARACAAVNAVMVYVGTDYVFDGSKSGAYNEDDRPNPINVYGRTKWEGEKQVNAHLERHFIVRTSWLYGAGGRNFVTTILKAAKEQKDLRVVNDQQGSPTYTRHLATTIAELIETQAYGLYHATGAGSCTWFEFARAILDLWPVTGVQVLAITSSESGRPARRPVNSVLENRALQQANLRLMPDWRISLAEYLEEIKLSAPAV